MAEPISTPFGTFVQTPSGEFQPYASTPFGTFTQGAGGQWQAYSPPSTTGGTTGTATDQHTCPPGMEWDQETNSCVPMGFIAQRQAQRDQQQQQQKALEDQQKLFEQQKKLFEQQAAETRRAAQESAKGTIAALLADYGLSSLTDWIWGEITKGDITSTPALVQLIRKRPEYAARFPGMAQRISSGFNAISEQAYIDLEQSYRQTLRSAGLPTGFYDDPTDFGALIGGDVSVAEVAQRIKNGYQAVAQSNPQVINEMKRLYGIDESGLAAYFLDPQRATPILMRQAQAAQIGAQATTQAQMELSQTQAEQIGRAHV